MPPNSGASFWRLAFVAVPLSFATGRPAIVAANAPQRERGQALPPVWSIPSGYRLARLLMSSRSRMNSEERIFVSHFLAAEPTLDAAITWARQLNKLLRRTIVESLEDVLVAASGTLFARYAASLRRDFEAINAALALPLTTSPVEGQVSGLKMLKRTIYGRAGFELLCAWVLNAA